MATPAEDALPSCAQGGVLGAVAGVLGTLQAVEVVKELAGIGTSLSGTLLLYDAAAAQPRAHPAVAAEPPAPAALPAGTGLSGESCRDDGKIRPAEGLRRMSRRRFGLRGRDRLR